MIQGMVETSFKIYRVSVQEISKSIFIIKTFWQVSVVYVSCPNVPISMSNQLHGKLSDTAQPY